MTGEKIRDIGFLAWEINLAYLEHMQGKAFKNTLRHEKHYFNMLSSQSRVKHLASAFEDDFEKSVKPYMDCEGITIAGVIDVTYKRTDEYEWKWKWSTRKKKALNIDCDGTFVWYSTYSSDESTYRYDIVCEAMDGRIIWKKVNVSIEFVINKGILYYIMVDYPFDTTGIAACDAYTGKGEKEFFIERDPERFISIIKGANDSVFLESGTWSESKLWLIHGRSVERIYEDSRFQIPLDSKNYLLVDSKTLEQYAKGPIIESWILPPKPQKIDWVNINSGHVISHNEGAYSIWYCAAHKKPIRIFGTEAGDITPNYWAMYHNEIQQDFYIRSPESPPWIIHIIGTTILNNTTCGPYTDIVPALETKRISTNSANGTRVSYLLVHEKGVNPTKLLCYVYGAYGLGSVVMWPYMFWGPLLKRGWAVAYSYPRGSGDRNEKWMLEGQGHNHIKTIEDFEAVIKDAQKRLNISSKRTAIYGRSAGGLMVGAVTARNPDGRLMGATFTEVPFVDGVRSQTNPTLPLVMSGMSEYGNPLNSIENFQALLRISPIDSLPSDGAPGVFVLARTGLKDLQVIPFEPVKWIQRLRGKADPPAGKFLAFERDQQHVYTDEKYYKCRALDLAILDLWAEKKLTLPESLKKNRMYEYKMNQQQKKQQQGGKRKTHRRRSHRRRTHRRQQRK
jgi:hypothetical protein